MALGRKCSGSMKSKRGVFCNEDELGLGCVRYTRGLGRKRILISNAGDSSSSSSSDSSSEVVCTTPLKRQCSEKIIALESETESEKSVLESLPQEILVSSKRFDSNATYTSITMLIHGY